MKSLLLGAAFALVLPFAAMAQQAATPQEMGLSAPIIALMPVLMKNAEALKLDDAQKGEVKKWAESMGPKRMGMEKETAELRMQLRQAIIDNAPVADREALAAKIGSNETQLVMMRSNCVDNFRAVLSPEQLAEAVKMATSM